MLSIFARLDEKHNLLEMLKQLSKIYKKILKKIAQNFILAYFQK